jgi:hypothetical protein
MSALNIVIGLLVILQPLAAAVGANARPPSTPAHLAAAAVSDTEVALCWERVGDDEQGFTVRRSTGGAAFVPLATLPAGSNLFTDTSCYSSTVYAYQITADNDAGSSRPTEQVKITTKPSGATLPAATKFTATASAPFSIALAWNDPGAGYRNWLLERSADGASYSIIAVICGAQATARFVDTPLSPSTRYHYRLRQTSGVGYSDYTASVSVTTVGRAPGAPFEATELTATVNGATSVTLRWTDTNHGAARYVIETAPYSWSGVLKWTRMAITEPGATNHTLRTAPETFYYVRIRARTRAGESADTAPVVVRSASPGTGSPKVYGIGPDKPYARLAALDWSRLGPGDTVRIFPNRDDKGAIVPYHEKPLLSTRGTAAAPITIVGVKDPATGMLPIIDGKDAVTAAQWGSHYLPLEDLSLVLIGTRADNNGDGWSPGYIRLSNLEIRNSGQPDQGAGRTYTAHDGTAREYGPAYGIYIEKADHITIKDCVIHDNAGGVFGAGQGDHRNLEDVTFDSNQIYNNGKVTSYLEHNTYLEGINTVYQFNRYGPLRSGSAGGALKDRGAGTIIRYNAIQGGARLIDLVETQNYFSKVITLPSYRRAYVYGNLFTNTGDTGAQNAIHYGGDQGVTPAYRKGVLCFYNNTFVNRMDQSDVFRMAIFDLASGGETLDARNNIIYSLPLLTKTPPELNLLRTGAVAFLGRNWISGGFAVTIPGQPFDELIAGKADLIVADERDDPGLARPASGDFRLVAGSTCIDQGGPLTADAPAVMYEFVAPAGGQSRPVVGAAPDLGALESRP